MVAKKYNIPIGNDIRKFIISDVKKRRLFGVSYY